MKRVALLGATGSIGRQSLEIIEAHPELELVAAASGSQPIDGLAPLTQVGGDLTDLLERAEPDLVLNAVVGFAGLDATLWALERGIALALANKESLVVAGELALAAWERGGGLLLPVDSEHSAAFQCLEGRSRESVETLVLTASGGPFRGRTRDELADVTPAEALAHPTWNMGPKITIDSATLANKGLELIEAHFLFDLPYDRIEVVVHPTSIVHALVRFRDGAALAHLGYPGHARADLVRAHLSRSGRRRRSRRSTSRPASRSSSARPISRRSRCSRSRGAPGSAAGRIRARTTRRTRSRSRPSWTAGCRSSASPRSSRRRSPRRTARRARDRDDLVEADAEARAAGRSGVLA